MPYSKCKRMTVHAIGYDAEGSIEHARNGNPSKCRGEHAVGNCGCIHAEARLLRKMPNPVAVSVSHAPCINCAKLLVVSGVQSVTYLKPYRLTDGVDYLLEHGVLVFSALGE